MRDRVWVRWYLLSTKISLTLSVFQQTGRHADIRRSYCAFSISEVPLYIKTHQFSYIQKSMRGKKTPGDLAQESSSSSVIN